jgi:hypothetical protein
MTDIDQPYRPPRPKASARRLTAAQRETLIREDLVLLHQVNATVSSLIASLSDGGRPLANGIRDDARRLIESYERYQ